MGCADTQVSWKKKPVPFHGTGRNLCYFRRLTLPGLGFSGHGTTILGLNSKLSTVACQVRRFREEVILYLTLYAAPLVYDSGFALDGPMSVVVTKRWWKVHRSFLVI